VKDLRASVEELVRTWEHRATTQEDQAASATLMCARDAQGLLIRLEIEESRHPTTEPGNPPTESQAPASLPFMRWPTNLPKPEDK
jgi:hypothetical protein